MPRVFSGQYGDSTLIPIVTIVKEINRVHITSILIRSFLSLCIIILSRLKRLEVEPFCSLSFIFLKASVVEFIWIQSLGRYLPVLFKRKLSHHLVSLCQSHIDEVNILCVRNTLELKLASWMVVDGGPSSLSL